MAKTHADAKSGGVKIRPVRPEDAKDVHELRVMEGVRETILALPSERVSDTEDFIRNTKEPLMVAEVDGRVVGMAGLVVPFMARQRHTAGLGIMVHAGHQGRGIGRALMESLLDIADNWLMLKRVELTVFTDNERAVRLYESLGFVIEGTKKYAAVKNGVHADEYLMARYGK
ncbi:GNAT family N-acetyltransferase [Fretibacterium sp. OH1220_COT-178]|uniref:GNAT family N-acetyltransferase n=1 Tax=Fretibacterium sp. OH1220_COT-178 TaxID=2491047 RepID=UPI000F5F5DFF|nr:GNAT family N-acetyltransferase [Fretibacterium sp. OH1220_COT-178]RRD64538.1 GNAT family N-acetyltransferase [Fretibacterium sp. OH1220_COT-178]